MAKATPLTRESAGKNNRREVFGWMMYDWANSAFTTTVIAALFGPYIETLAKNAAAGNGGILFSLFGADVGASSFFPYVTSLSVLLQVLFLPILGAVADYTHYKKRFMAFFCYLGAISTCLFYTVTESTVLLGGLLFIIANLSFGASIVFYNAFLNEITTEDQRDKVSSRGFAVGYFGGGLLLAANLFLVTKAADFGMSTGQAVRLSLLSAGLWWAGFSLFTFAYLKTRQPVHKLPENQNVYTTGFVELGKTFKELKRLPRTFQYLIAYLFYNDGIQTVIAMSSVFLANELFVAKGLPADDATSFLLGLVLMIQFVAFAGALLFERIAHWLGTKNAIMIALVLWLGVIIYSFAFLQTVAEAWVMGAVIAAVLGGSQALSRSLFSRMIPHGREAAFYGLYEVSERGTSWMGPLIFGLVVGATNSYRYAILSLIGLFAVGLVLLYVTDTDAAIHESGNLLPEEAHAEQAAAVA